MACLIFLSWLSKRSCSPLKRVQFGKSRYFLCTLPKDHLLRRTDNWYTIALFKAGEISNENGSCQNFVIVIVIVIVIVPTWTAIINRCCKARWSGVCLLSKVNRAIASPSARLILWSNCPSQCFSPLCLSPPKYCPSQWFSLIHSAFVQLLVWVLQSNCPSQCFSLHQSAFVQLHSRRQS